MKLFSNLIIGLLFLWCFWHCNNQLTAAKTELEAIKDGIWVLVSAIFIASNFLSYYLDKDR